MVLYKGTVRVDNHLMKLMEQDGYDEFDWWTDQPSTLLRFGQGVIVILTGVAYGPVAVEIHVLTSSPPLELDRWEDVAEGDLTTEAGELMVSGMDSINTIPGGNAGVTPKGPAHHRVRVHANGRDIMFDEGIFDDDPPVENYLIQIWPATGTGSRIALKDSTGR
ncbi:hypothetical protein [Antrihabitans spumae]|uniref:Uncharacterized protein n=1 Tax=Antrihabitans spumae TaxID=3373370 RepID=A0ABW7KCJ5_9NOCA